MQIASKVAGEGFKIYSLCVANYLFACYFASPIGPKSTRIVGMQPVEDLPPTSAVCVRLAERLPKPWEYVIYLDNFFTREALLKHLKKLGFGACGTSKRGSGVHEDLLVFKELAKKGNDWGTRLITIIDDEILCMGWQDNNTVLMMSTAHTATEAADSEFRSIQRRHGIPEKSAVSTGHPGEKALEFPIPIVDYNKHMGGSDGCAQQRAIYTAARHHDVRYWWPIFIFLLDAAILNAYIVFQLEHPQSKLTHAQFQRQTALHMVRNPAGQYRQQPYAFGTENPAIPAPKHQWVRLSKKTYCTPCREAKRKRKPLKEMDLNVNKRNRGPQSYWGCSHPRCEGLTACKKTACWEALHS